MTTTDSLVDDILETLHGFGLAQDRAAFLTVPLTADASSITVGDATDFSQGIAEVDNETIFIESVDPGSGVLTVSPDGRGFYGTTAASHALGARLTMAPTWPRRMVLSALNDAILGVYPTLFGVGQASFTFTPSVTTYQIPAEADRVLAVTTATIGPSQEQVSLRRWSFNSNAVSPITTTNTLTLEAGGFPGRTVTVTYLKQPSELTWGQDFTASGLRETARTAIKYAACSLLTAYMDSARLPVDTAQADEYDPSRAGIGTASKISGSLYQRYQLELDQERRRQRLATKVPINVRTR